MALCRRGHDSVRISELPREPARSPRHPPRPPWSLRNVRAEIRSERSPAAPPEPRTESGTCRSLVTTQEFTPSRRNNEAKQENRSGVHRHAVHSTRSPARPPRVYGNSGQHQAANPLSPQHTETPRPGRSSPPRTHRVAHGQAGDRTRVTCQQRASSPCEAASGLSLPLAATTTCLREASRCGISSSWSLTVGQMLGNYLALIQNAQLAEQRGPERQGHLRGHWPETGTPTSTCGYFSLVLSPFSTICAQHTNPDGDVLLS